MNDIERLDLEIATLSSKMAAATYDLLVKIRTFDELGGWAEHGALSCAHWLNWRVGLDLGAAREKVRVARALAALPLLSSAFAKGTISYSKIRAITRIATPDNEAKLLGLANVTTASHIERFIRALRKIERVPAESKRALEIFEDDDGMVVIRGRLLAEEGAFLRKALAAMPTPKQGMNMGQRNADALVLLAERAMSGSNEGLDGADRVQVIVHVDANEERSNLDGAHVSAETSRRLSCDASEVWMTHGANREVLNVGRKTRRISVPLRRALVERDHGCRFPGCTNRIVDGHHIKHWRDGGETNLPNTILLCRRHHRFVHEHDFTVELRGNQAIFTEPSGRVVPDTGQLSLAGEEALEHYDTELMPTWAGHPMDLGLAVDRFLPYQH